IPRPPSMIFAELAPLVLTGNTLGRGGLRWNPRRTFFDGATNISRAVQHRLFIIDALFDLGANPDGTIAEQPSFGSLFLGEVFVGCLWVRRATHRVDEDVVLVVLESKNVGDDVLRDPTLFVRADSPFEPHEPVAHVYGQVINIERAVRCQMLPHEPSQLVITQIIDVVDVFEVASHGSTSVRVSRPVTVLSREQIRE